MKLLIENWRKYLNENEDFGYVMEAIEIDLTKSLKKDFYKIADITTISPSLGMTLASSDPVLEKMYIQYLQNLKPSLDAALPGQIEILKNFKKMYAHPKHPNHYLIQQMSDLVSASGTAQAEIEKILSTSNVNSSPDRQIKKVDK